MKRIISSQFYQLRCNFSLLRISLLLAAAIAGMSILWCATSEYESSAGNMFIENDGISWLFQVMLIGVFAGMICAGDFADKDLNYELMNGHSRRSIYIARVLLCVGLASVVSTLCAFLPYMATSAVYGWGERIRAADVYARTALFFFPFIRIAAFFCMLAFIIKKQSIVITLGFVTEMGCILLHDIVTEKCGYILGIFNLMELVNVGEFSLYNVVPGTGIVEYTRIEGALSKELVVCTITVSLVMTLIYLIAGYAFFQRDDLD